MTESASNSGEAVIERLLDTLGSERATVESDFRHTIGRSGGSEGALEKLEELKLRGEIDGFGPRLVMGRRLGSGGMGEVRLAEQRSLGRDIAVKSLRPDRQSADAAEKLLTEAWVAGAMEHPNIAPVYDIGLDADGHPMIVLKRIEGSNWSELMQDPKRIEAEFGVTDPLAWNLRVLLSVCDAIEFAHSKGILHRDIKPENVMVGGFGEVYLVDWGVAVSTTDDGTHRFPLATDHTALVGTPVYLAPEMVREEISDERTDVFLLGATLYEILTGRPPHLGGTIFQVLRSALDCNIAEPEDGPRELMEVCRRAVSFDRDERFQTAALFRNAIIAFLDHRAALELIDLADRRFDELQVLLNRTEEDADGVEFDVSRLYAECRFGYLQAHRQWPESQAAAKLEHAASAVASFELARGAHERAASILAEIGAEDPALLEIIEEVRAQRAGEQALLEKLVIERDKNVGGRKRQILVIVLGLAWLTAPLLQVLGQLDMASYRGLITRSLVMTMVVSVAIWFARDVMASTRYNRALAGVALIASPIWLIVAVGDYLMGMDIVHANLTIRFIWVAVTGLITVAIDRRMWPACLTFVATTLAAANNLSLLAITNVVANLVLAGTLLVMLWPRKSEPLSPGLRGIFVADSSNGR